LIKFLQSGRFLPFSNYNNQVFIFEELNFLAEGQAETNKNKVAQVSSIFIDEYFAVFGNRDGFFYIH
jgi:hypothetical protein